MCVGVGVLFGDVVLFGHCAALGTAVLMVLSATANGDGTATMAVSVDTGFDFLAY